MNLTRSTLLAVALVFGAAKSHAAPLPAPGAKASVIGLVATKPKKAAAKKAAPKKAAPKAKKVAKATGCKGAYMYSKGGKCMDARNKK